MSVANRPVHRPLSPHLQVYKPQLTSVLSILHRATGMALSVGALYLALWVICAAAGGGLTNCFALAPSSAAAIPFSSVRVVTAVKDTLLARSIHDRDPRGARGPSDRMPRFQ